MTILITEPETEELINQRLQTGAFKDAEDVVLQALRFSQPNEAPGSPEFQALKKKTFVELFEPVRGLNIDFEADRKSDFGRDIDL